MEELNKDTDVERNKIYTYKGKKYVSTNMVYGCHNCAFLIKAYDIDKGIINCMKKSDFSCSGVAKSLIFLPFEKVEELQNEILKYDEVFSKKFAHRYTYYPVDRFHKSLFNSFIAKKLSRKQAFYMAIKIIKEGSSVDKINKINLNK